MKGENLNRIKAVLAEKRVTQKELAEALNVTPGAVSTWCRNFKQPDLHTLYEIASFINVEVWSLLNSMENAGYVRKKS